MCDDRLKLKLLTFFLVSWDRLDDLWPGSSGFQGGVSR